MNNAKLILSYIALARSLNKRAILLRHLSCNEEISHSLHLAHLDNASLACCKRDEHMRDARRLKADACR